MARIRRLRRKGADDYVVRNVKDGAGRLLPYTPPWLVWLTLPLWVAMARGLASAGMGAAMVVAVGLTLSVLGLAAFTWHSWRARPNSIRVHATAFVSGCGAWVLWAAIAGLWRTPAVDGWHLVTWLGQVFNWPVWGVWLFAGTVGCLTWSIRRAGRGDGTDTVDDGGLMKAIGAAGRTGVPQLEADGTRVRVPVRMARGEATMKDLEPVKDRIAGWAGVRRTGVRIESDGDSDPSRGDIVFVPRDLLKGTIAWRGPSAPGESIAEAIPVALAEDGEVGKLWLPGDPKLARPALHLGIAGMTGSGKTESALVTCGELLTRRDVSLVWSDHVKGLQSVAPIAAGVSLLLTDKAAAVAAFRRLPVVIAHRTHFMGQHGFSQWTQDVHRKTGLKYLVYWLEEGAALIANSELFVQLTEQARSAGISIVLSQQRFSHDRLPTSARSNLGGGWCFGVRDETDASFVLSEQTIDAGAAPWTWQNRKPGYSYLEGPGIAEDRWAVPHRAMLADRDHLREVVAEFCPQPILDPTTATAFGKVYSEYRLKVIGGQADWQNLPTKTVIPMPGVAAPSGSTATVGQAPTDADDVDGDLDDGPDPDLEVPAQPEPGFMDDADPAQEIERDDDDVVSWAPKPGQPRPTASAAKRLLREELQRRVDAGQEVITTTELVEYRTGVLRRSPSWLSGALRELVDEGVLEMEPDRGAYRLLAPVPA